MKKCFFCAALCAGIAAGLFAGVAQASIYLMEDFSGYANGNLVPQNGWTQLGATATLPLQVAGGTVPIPGAQGADNQDAYHNLSASGGVIPAPGAGTTTVYMGLKMSVQSAPTVDFSTTNPSYFAASYTGDNAGGFANERLYASASGAGFVLSAKVTGQSGAPFGTGSTVLNYGELYNVIVRADMNAGAGNDTVSIYVNPTSGDVNSETPYVTVGVGTGTDPSGIGSFVLSQFENATTLNAGVTLNSIVVADKFAQAAMIPEPASIVLLGLASLALVGRRRRRG